MKGIADGKAAGGGQTCREPPYPPPHTTSTMFSCGPTACVHKGLLPPNIACTHYQSHRTTLNKHSLTLQMQTLRQLALVLLAVVQHRAVHLGEFGTPDFFEIFFFQGEERTNGPKQNCENTMIHENTTNKPFLVGKGITKQARDFSTWDFQKPVKSGTN